MHSIPQGREGDRTAARLAGRCCPCFGAPKVEEKEEVKEDETQEEVTQEEVPQEEIKPEEVKEEEVKPEEVTADLKMVTKVWVIYYSTYGHVAKLAEEILKGANSVEGVEATLYQVPETLPEEVLAKMYAAPKNPDVPIIDVHKLPEADGFLFGFPTRYGGMAAQFKAFFDATGQLWQAQALAGKPAGFFFSTATQGGGQETTALTSIPNLVNHGMIYVPIAYTAGASMFEMGEVKGGSPYGAGTFANVDGSRQPSKLELETAFHQGKYTATIAKKLKA